MFKASIPLRIPRRRGTLATAALITIVVAALILPLTAQAAPRRFTCTDAGCHEDCQQQLPNGDTAYYTDGTTITLRDGKTGEEIKFKCVDGQWQKVSEFQLPDWWKGIQVLGNIGVGSMGGLKGDTTITQPECIEGTCTEVGPVIGPPPLTAAPS